MIMNDAKKCFSYIISTLGKHASLAVRVGKKIILNMYCMSSCFKFLKYEFIL